MSDVAQPLFGATPERAANVLAPRQWLDGLTGHTAPFVSGLSVDGFGALANLEVRDLSPGLNVLLGQNEAGKSTLFDFVTGVLFGFPARKADEHFRLPVNGGRHGGRVAIVDTNGELVVVERHGAPQKQLVLTLADGSAGDESDLARLLGGASKDLFRAVFAVDLDDLRRLDGLSSDEIRETLFSSSVVGQRRSAARALRELDSAREALVKPRQGGKSNQLASELREVRRELARARTEAGSFASLQREADRRSDEIGRLHRELADARVQARDLELLQRCWNVVVDQRQAAAALDQLPPLSLDDTQALNAGSRVTKLRVALSGHLQRLEQFEAAQAQCMRLVQSIDERVEKLGPWAREVAGDASVNLVALREQLEECSASVATATADRDAARRLLAKAQGELAPAAPAAPAPAAVPAAAPAPAPAAPAPAVVPATTPAVRSVISIEGRLRSLRELRGLVSEADTLGREVEHDAERERMRRAQLATASEPSALHSGALTSIASAVILFVIAAVLVARGQSGLGALVGVVAVAVAVAVSITWRRRTAFSGGAAASGRPPAGSPVALPDFSPERHQRLQAIRLRIAEQAVECGVPEPVLLVSVQRAIDDAEAGLAERRRLDDLARVELDLVSRSRSASAALQAAEDALGAARHVVIGVARDCGLPVSGDAAHLLRLVAQLVELRDRMAAQRRIEAEGGQGSDEIRSYEATVYELANSLGLQCERPGEGGGLLPGETLERILTAGETKVGAAQALDSERAGLESRRNAADRELDRMLGEGDHADALRADLASGRVREWEAEASASEERVATLEEQYERLVREHEGLVRQLDELLRSDDIPVLELRCQQLETELDVTMREYLVASGARLLVHRTLRRYEAERQPAVLSCAGEHFARVTGGRYARLVVDSAPDGSNPVVQVVRENGSHIDASALSRGTIEQLYLCLRLALAESFAERYLPLPIVLDDVLVNFDPVRSEAIVRELAEAASHHQVLALTCHPHLAELMSSIAGDAHVVEIARN